MSRKSWATLWFILAGACGLVMIFLSVTIGHKVVSYGAAPTSEGIGSIVVSILGTLGFSLSGIVSLCLHAWWPAVPSGAANQLTEVTASFAALIKSKDDRAAQRRFLFALVDAGPLFKGIATSHENGVIVIKYSGFADPVTTGVAT